ncbi:MAG: thiamine phosphate synthase [Magnetococcales bacterium]|nr:thiamine phosphate synthase [Magnetococcales bacterium]
MSPYAHLIQGPYPILDADWLEKVALSSESVCQVLNKFAIPVVQLRCKGDGGRHYDFSRHWVQHLRAHAPQTKIIINDRLDIALALKADGIHVGQDDLPVSVCRQLMGSECLVGLSTHTVEEIQAANAADVDYVGFGPVFGTQTKPDAWSRRGIDALRLACTHSNKPLVAIGGISVDTLQEVRSAGAQSAAMISGLFHEKQWAEQFQQAVDIFS